MTAVGRLANGTVQKQRKSGQRKQETMIVNHEHEFIFLKTAKTAGTTCEIALSQFCGPNDIITSISSEDERKRQALGYRGPQNQEVPLRHYTLMDWLRFLVKRHSAKYRNHFTALSARRYLDDKVWKNYFKFCFERNPYDQAVSRYFYSTRAEDGRPSVTEFLDEAPRLSNWEIYTIDDDLAVDFVGRYEHLQEDMSSAAREIGLPSDLSAELASIHAKGSHRETRQHYSELLDEEARAHIRSVCAREIDLLNYSFERVE